MSLALQIPAIANQGIIFDIDAQAFITAAGITDLIQQRAINNLVIGLKTGSLWDKIYAHYPTVGGTATTHKFNLKDPRDLDEAFRLVFFGGWIHSETGVKPNGTDAYADTNLNILNVMTLNDLGLSYYSRESINTNLNVVDIGVSWSSISFQMSAGRKAANINNTALSNISFNGNGSASVIISDSLGFYTASRRSATDNELFKNGVSIATNIDDWGVSDLGSYNIYFGARNLESVAANFNQRECATAIIHRSLTDTEAANLYNIIQTFNTDLNRQV